MRGYTQSEINNMVLKHEDFLRNDCKVARDERKMILDRLDSLPTKQDLANFATKQDLDNFATKQDLDNFATKQDLVNYATKQDLDDLYKRIRGLLIKPVKDK